MRLAILIGVFFTFITEMLLMSNTLSNMYFISQDIIMRHWETKMFLRLGILAGLLVFVGIVNNSHFEFLTLKYWRNKFKK